MNNPYEWLQNFIQQVPDILQPVMVALVGAIPYIEGEAAAAFGIIAGINPIVAAIAGATGNILCVVGVVFLGSRIRERVIARRAAKTAGADAGGAIGATSLVATPINASNDSGPTDTVTTQTAGVTTIERSEDEPDAKPTRGTKGRARLRRWVVRFGVPGASILAPLALPTMLTAAFFVASGVSKRWVILWQAIAIVLWTGGVAILATGALALLGW